MLSIKQIPALQDNYIYVLCDPDSGHAAVIDPTLAAPVLQFLAHEHWQLTYILNTHHHGDHIGGNIELQQHTGCKIFASSYDSQRIPGVDQALNEGDHILLGEHTIKVLETPGHTLGHIVYYLPEQAALFCGDTLFAMGCGRLFEGSAAQLWQSLQKIMALPQATWIYCAHEYTEANTRFARSVDPTNPALLARTAEIVNLRQQHKPTVPFTLADELATNPFLRVTQVELQNQLGMQGAHAVDIFTHLRKLKDKF